MIVAPLMNHILSLAFGLAVSDGKLIRRFAVIIGFGVLAVVGTAALISLGLGISDVQSEITSRTSQTPSIWASPLRRRLPGRSR